tara:strand:- start:41 stop:586 length:546 start_codon:yes stop_codon:yes gene_type:complete
MTIISNSNKKIKKIKSEICKHIELYDDSKNNDDKTELKLLIRENIYKLIKEDDQDTMNLIKDKNTMKLINGENIIIGIAHGLCPKHTMSSNQIKKLLNEMNIAPPKTGGKKKTPTKKPVKKSPPKKNPTTKPKSKSKTMTDYKKDDLVKIAKRKDVSLTGRDKKPKTKEQLYRSLKYHKCI